jgi:hypothetical protein
MARATVESFFKSLTAELVWRRNWQARREVEIALFEYINGFYNPRRKHPALGWKSPVAFEKGRLTWAHDQNETGAGPSSGYHQYTQREVPSCDQDAAREWTCQIRAARRS